ncbi:uncharacterized protein LOC134352571 [Mobula hypostoma]|uniref:uncharacterized protein LOC134352571 n=1 Tax=Mobula hypostoma TaxID=723540 RepID=UPI002FC30A4C
MDKTEEMIVDFRKLQADHSLIHINGSSVDGVRSVKYLASRELIIPENLRRQLPAISGISEARCTVSDSAMNLELCDLPQGSQSCCKCVNRVVPLNEQQEKEFSAAGSQGNHSCPPDDNILQASRENWQNPRAPGISGTGYDPAVTPIPRPFLAWDPAPMDPSRSGTAIPVGAFSSAEGPGCPECNRDVGSSGLEEQQPQDGLDESVPSPAESPSLGTVPSSSTGQEEGEDVLYPSKEAAPASSIPDSELLRVPPTDYEFWAIFNFAGTEAARMLLIERREKAAAEKTSIS